MHEAKTKAYRMQARPDNKKSSERGGASPEKKRYEVEEVAGIHRG
jgi:hypothetical protein